jgi:hypothetical protein
VTRLLDWADRRRVELRLVAATLTVVAVLGYAIGEPAIVAEDQIAASTNATISRVAVDAVAVAELQVPLAPVEPATALSLPVRGPSIQVTDTLPPPSAVVTAEMLVPSRSRWGRSNSSIDGRCSQFEPVIAFLAPPDGWSVPKMSGYSWREGSCCPQLLHPDGSWRVTQGGDRTRPVYDADDPVCVFSHVAVWFHRSDSGILQINGINYKPSRCGSNCILDVTQVELGDAITNIQSAATLCTFGRRAWNNCYQPWGGHE